MPHHGAPRGRRFFLLAVFALHAWTAPVCWTGGPPVAMAGPLGHVSKGEGEEEGFEFSARVVWRAEGATRDALLFVKRDRYRIEHRGGIETDLGVAGVSIVREDRNEVWYVLSRRRSYLALPLSPAHLLHFSVTLEGEISRTLVGDAMAAGRPAQLFEVVVERYGRRETFFEWIDPENRILLKLVNKHQDWSVEYQHVVFSEQPSYYFEVPRGYRRIEAREQGDEKGRAPLTE